MPCMLTNANRTDTEGEGIELPTARPPNCILFTASRPVDDPAAEVAAEEAPKQAAEIAADTQIVGDFDEDRDAEPIVPEIEVAAVE